MPKITYQNFNFYPSTLETIEQAKSIVEEYQKQGLNLTVRQLYYQFVSKDLITNNMTSYNRIKKIVSNARLAGLIDWDSIVDRTRNVRSWSHSKNISSALNRAAWGFSINRWENQPIAVEVWVEKEALIGVIETPCGDLDVPYFACKGYVSQSALWRAGQRVKNRAIKGQETVVLHLGDHDPSGIDMTRDNEEKLRLFSGSRLIRVNRIALNYDQIEEYNPPPNPTKLTDPRAEPYIKDFGHTCWELDALKPTVLDKLIRNCVSVFIDQDVWQKDRKREEEGRNKILEYAAMEEENEN